MWNNNGVCNKCLDNCKRCTNNYTCDICESDVAWTFSPYTCKHTCEANCKDGVNGCY